MRWQIPGILIDRGSAQCLQRHGAAGFPAIGRALFSVRGSVDPALLNIRDSYDGWQPLADDELAVFDQQRCLIDDIRQVDYKKMQRDAAAQRGAAAETS